MVKPILFSPPMVKAILDGNKTMTRRVIKPQPKCRLSYIYAGANNGKWHYPPKEAVQRWGEAYRQPKRLTKADRDALWTPPCHVGDILWVRETWAKQNGNYLYAVGDATDENYMLENGELRKWRPSIHMPKEAARIFLRVTKVSVERLQDISVEDITREALAGLIPTSTFTFRRFWDSLRKPADLDKYGWKANPWVWVISFERCEEGDKNKDRVD